MKAFLFPLQNLLTLRSQRTEKAFQKWGHAQRELQQVVLASQRIQSQLKSSQLAQREQQSTIILVADLKRNYQSVQAFHQLLVEHEKLRKLMEIRVHEIMMEWQEARRKEEILERLRHRSWLRWLKEVEKEEQKLNDERGSILAFYESNRSMAHSRMQVFKSNLNR